MNIENEFELELSKVTSIPKQGMKGSEGLNNLLKITTDFSKYVIIENGEEHRCFDHETLLFIVRNLERFDRRLEALSFFYDTFNTANDIYLGKVNSRLEPHTLQSISKFLKIALSNKFQNNLSNV